jgi:drug/metabolite transporter (DMT)-like permease
MLILYVVWGSTYLGIRIAIETIPPFSMAAIRFFIAGSVLFGVTLLRERRSFAPPTRREWRDTFIVAGFLLGGGMGMVAWGEQTVPSGIAALIIALMPLWVAVIGRVFLAERLPGAAVVGVLVGLVGVAILVVPAGAGANRFDPAGVAALVLSPILWAIGSLFAAHRAQLPRRPLLATGMQMLAGGIILGGMAVATGEPARIDIPAISAESLVALAYLTVIGSLVAFTAYGWLLRVAPLPLIATYAYVNPIVAVILGALLVAEEISPRTAVAGAVIVFAVALIITARSRMSAPRTRDLPKAADASVTPATVISVSGEVSGEARPTTAGAVAPGAVAPGAVARG